MAFPNFHQPWCAWIALVPWLVGLRRTSARAAFGWSWLVGWLFFLGSIWWLVLLGRFGGAVAILGWLILCAYFALYFGLFGWLVARGSALHAPPSRLYLLVIPSVWVALEYLRSHLLSGWGWNLLGYSQTPWLPVIQVADVTGVWGVSWLLVLVNAAIAQWWCSRNTRPQIRPVLIAAGFVALACGYGWAHLAQPHRGTSVRIAVVQGNIPQEQKWDEAYQHAVLQQFERLTRDAAVHEPVLIVWPETSAPGFLNKDEAVAQRVQHLAAAVSVPLLVGAPMVIERADGWKLTNSAALLGQDGALLTRYDKLHLVPFGEFVPLTNIWPWLRGVVPPTGNFVPGHDYTVFTLPVNSPTHHSSLRFSVLICFEDIFPELARRFAREGAQWLITITNDAWFGPTAAAYQHAQAATFRAVELRVPMVRAANTGWSGCIDAQGRWLTSVRDQAGQELFVDGVATCEVAAAEGSPTLYHRWGDWFAWLCVFVTGWWVVKILAGAKPPGAVAAPR